MTTLTLYQYLINHHIDFTQFDQIAFVILYKGIEWTFYFSIDSSNFSKFAKLINVHNLTITPDFTERQLILKDQVIMIPIDGGWQHNLSSIISNIVHISCSLHIFDNLELNSTLIHKTIFGFSGCYYFFNKINGNGYVGSSINLSKRLQAHSQYKNKIKSGKSQIIHSAFAKYGLSNFAYLCFLLSSNLDVNFNSIASLAQEQFLLHHLINIIYNVNKLADRSQIKTGVDHQNYNTGFPLYLYKVLADDWYISKGEYYTPVTKEDQEFIKEFPNVSRAIEETGIIRSTLYRNLSYSNKPIRINRGNYKGIYFISKTPWH